MIPVFVVDETTNLVEAVTQNLHGMLGDKELPVDLVRGLLSKQRLLVIVDALSERGPETQQYIEQIFGSEAPINAMVITSRIEPRLGAISRTVLYPVRLDAARIVPFIIGYSTAWRLLAPLRRAEFNWSWANASWPWRNQEVARRPLVHRYWSHCSSIALYVGRGWTR